MNIVIYYYVNTAMKLQFSKIVKRYVNKNPIFQTDAKDEMNLSR